MSDNFIGGYTREARWRLGGKVRLNVYCGDVPMFQCHTPEDTKAIVALLNAGEKFPAYRDSLSALVNAEHTELPAALQRIAELEKQQADLKPETLAMVRRDKKLAELKRHIDAIAEALGQPKEQSSDDGNRTCARCGRTELGWRYNRCPNCGEMADESKEYQPDQLAGMVRELREARKLARPFVEACDWPAHDPLNDPPPFRVQRREALKALDAVGVKGIKV